MPSCHGIKGFDSFSFDPFSSVPSWRSRFKNVIEAQTDCLQQREEHNSSKLYCYICFLSGISRKLLLRVIQIAICQNEGMLMMKFFLMLVLSMSLLFQSVTADEIPVIDAHSQFDHTVKVEKIIKLMDKAGVSRTILSTRGKVLPPQLVAFAQKNEGRIIPAVRTKGKPYAQDSPKYYNMLKNQLNMDGFGAMAEVIMFHAQKGNKAPKVVVPPNDKRVQTALNGALRNGWPFIVHIEFAASRGERETFMKQFEKMLSSHPDKPFVLIHMGQLGLEEVSRLIYKHANIYFITAHTNPISLNKSRQPWVNMFSGNVFTGYQLDQKWKALIINHPDRFVLGFDNVFEEHWGNFYLDQVKLWKKVLAELPLEVAHKLAHKNAERLWGLPLL